MVGAKTAAVLGLVKKGKTVKEAMTTVFKPKTSPQSPAQIYGSSPLPKIGQVPTPPPSSGSIGPVYQPPAISTTSIIEPEKQIMTKQEFVQETQNIQDVLGTKYQESQKMVETKPAKTFKEQTSRTIEKFQKQGIKTGYVKSQYLSGYARNLPPSATVEKTPTGYVVHRDVLAEQKAEYQQLPLIQKAGRALYVGVTQWPGTIYESFTSPFTGKSAKQYSEELITWEAGTWKQAKSKEYLGFAGSTLTTPAMTDIVLPFAGGAVLGKGLGYVGRTGVALSARTGTKVGTRILGKTMGYYPYAVGGIFTGLASGDIISTGVYESKGLAPSGSTAKKLLSTGTQFTSAYFGVKAITTPKISNIKEPNIIIRTKGIKPLETTQLTIPQAESSQRFLYAPKTNEVIPLESDIYSSMSNEYMPMEYGAFKNLRPIDVLSYGEIRTKMFAPKTIQYTLENKPRIEFRSILGKTDESTSIKPYKFPKTVQKRLYEYQPIVRFEVNPITGKLYTREIPRRFMSNIRAETSLLVFKELNKPKSLSFESELFTGSNIKPFIFPGYINVNVYKKALGSIPIQDTSFSNVNINKYGEMNISRFKPSNMEGNINRVITTSLEDVDVISIQSTKQSQMLKQDKSLVQRYEKMNKQITKMKPKFEKIKVPKIIKIEKIKMKPIKGVRFLKMDSLESGYHFRKWKTPKISDLLKIKGW